MDKLCGKCLRRMPPSEFHNNKSLADGLNPYCKECSRAASRESSRKRRLREVSRFIEIQDGRCANPACGVDISATDQYDPNIGHLDHDHACCTKRWCRACLRGVLCGNCNMGLGNFHDSPAKLRGAIWYLETWQEYGEPPALVAKRQPSLALIGHDAPVRTQSA